MADHSGYEYMHEESINELLKCSICTKPFIDPVSTKCDTKPHLFCRHCIEERVRRNSLSCPTCRQNLSIQDLTPITHGIIKDMLDQILVKCLSCEQTELKRSNFDAHKREVCPMVNVVCPLSDIRCPWRGPRGQLDQHMNSCVFNLLKPLIIELQNDNQRLTDQTKQLNERLQLLELMNFTPLICKGRPCLKCKKCSDWYYDGKEWKRRIGYTCTDYVATDRGFNTNIHDDRPVSDTPGMVGHHVGGFFGGGDILCQCRH